MEVSAMIPLGFLLLVVSSSLPKMLFLEAKVRALGFLAWSTPQEELLPALYNPAPWAFVPITSRARDTLVNKIFPNCTKSLMNL